LHSTLADLEIATFAVDEVVVGTQTGREANTLVVSPSQLAVGAGEPALAEATVEVVRPGDPVRISNVLDAVLPSVVHDDPGATFPGVLGLAGDLATAPNATAGGRIDRLGGVAVLPVCDWRAAGYAGPEELPDAFVDMAGPGASRSPFGSTSNVVLRFVPAAGAPVDEVDLAIRRCTLRVARDLAASGLTQEADDVRSLAWPPPAADADLPAVALILQVASEGPLTDTFLDGAALTDLAPTAIDPRRVMAGNLTNGAYDWAAVRNVTSVYQQATLLRELWESHGERLRFVGVVLAPGYLDTAAQKQAAAASSAELVRDLGADGAICTTFSSGNSHTDTMLTIRACEAAGIRTTGLVCETNGGLTDHVPEADCLVSTGNEDELVEAWSPSRVIGDRDDGGARSGEPVPTWAYLAACVQTGDTTWTAVPA
jgi:Glycine/sarcosine/betaine reductase component B subunits